MPLEWHLDVVTTDGPPLLVVIEPYSMQVEREEIRECTADAILRAMRSIMLRTVPQWPHAIITDNARYWSGLGTALGLRHEFYPASETTLDKIARRLIEASA